MSVKPIVTNIILAASVAGKCAAGALVFLVMIKEPILHLSLAFEWALDEAKRTRFHVLSVPRNETLPRAYLLLLLFLVALHGISTLGRPTTRRGRLLPVVSILLWHAVLTAELELTNQIPERPIERSRDDHVLATVWAGTASLLGLGKTIETVGVPIRTGRRGLFVNAQA